MQIHNVLFGFVVLKPLWCTHARRRTKNFCHEACKGCHGVFTPHTSGLKHRHVKAAPLCTCVYTLTVALARVSLQPARFARLTCPQLGALCVCSNTHDERGGRLLAQAGTHQSKHDRAVCKVHHRVHKPPELYVVRLQAGLRRRARGGGWGVLCHCGRRCVCAPSLSPPALLRSCAPVLWVLGPGPGPHPSAAGGYRHHPPLPHQQSSFHCGMLSLSEHLLLTPTAAAAMPHLDDGHQPQHRTAGE